jgi:Fic family protein
MADVKQRLRTHLPKLYFRDLLNNLFRHPYTRIQFVRDDLNVTRQTAADYLEQLAEKGFLVKHKSGRSNYYNNSALVTLFLQISEGP